MDLTLLSASDNGGTPAVPLDAVVSRCLQQVAPLLSAALLAQLGTDGSERGNTGPCSSGGGEAMLLALDMSGRLVDDNRRVDEDSPPVMKFSSLSTQASW